MTKCCETCYSGIFTELPLGKNGKKVKVNGYCHSIQQNPLNKPVFPTDGQLCKFYSAKERNKNCRVEIVHPDGSTTAIQWDDRTSPLVDTFWDCECKEDYFRPASQKKCKKCGALQSDMPSSRLSELVEWLIKQVESQPGELEYPVERTPATIESED